MATVLRYRKDQEPFVVDPRDAALAEDSEVIVPLVVDLTVEGQKVAGDLGDDAHAEAVDLRGDAPLSRLVPRPRGAINDLHGDVVHQVAVVVPAEEIDQVPVS